MRRRRGPAIAVEPDVARFAVACDGGDDAIGAHATDAVVGRWKISDTNIHAAVRSHGNAPGAAELRRRGRAAVTAKARHSGSRDGGDDAIKSHAADAGVISVGNIEAAISCNG